MVLDTLFGVCESLQVVPEAKLRKCDILVAMGGDGTVLSTARYALGKGTPLLGINTGRIGFLAEFQVENLTQTFDMLLSDALQISPHMMLDFEIRKGHKVLGKGTVLNEVALEAIEPTRMVDLEVRLNGSHLTEYWADSLLVSTPTGSTAYNLSAGGPILHPATQALVLTPVNSVSLSVRPLVIPAESKLVIRELAGKPIRIRADGHCALELEPGQELVLTKSRHVTNFIQTNQSGFVEALREKLGWTGKPKLKP